MKRILFYGGGNIAQAIIYGLLSSGLDKSSIFYIDRNKTNQLKLKKLGIKKYVASDDAIDLIILCVKPKDALDAYKAIAENFSNIRLNKQGNPLFFGILHQPFEEYANSLGRTIQEEWAKIQGRYEDIPFSINFEETVHLIAKVLA